jgi:hypothetical protein
MSTLQNPSQFLESTVAVLNQFFQGSDRSLILEPFFKGSKFLISEVNEVWFGGHQLA